MEYQKFNRKIKAWVKFRRVNGRPVITNVKERKPKMRFKGVKVRK